MILIPFAAGLRWKALNPDDRGLEAEVGIEPTHDGFANHCLTTWLLRRALGAGASDYVLAGRVSMPGIAEIVVKRAVK